MLANALRGQKKLTCDFFFQKAIGVWKLTIRLKCELICAFNACEFFEPLIFRSKFEWGKTFWVIASLDAKNSL